MSCEEAYKVVSKEKRPSSDGDEEKLEIECLHEGRHCGGLGVVCFLQSVVRDVRPRRLR